MKATVGGHTVDVGDAIGFESDTKQYGIVTKISPGLFGGHQLTLKSPYMNGFYGETIGGQQTVVKHSNSCWLI